jgi:hypothetical protein
VEQNVLPPECGSMAKQQREKVILISDDKNDDWYK